MRSLTLKLTLAFLFVGLTGALLVAVFVGVRTQREFGQFVSDRYQQDLIDELASYYQRNGSWDGIDAIAFRLPPGIQAIGRAICVRRWLWSIAPRSWFMAANATRSDKS